jgi:hypothetical protein
VKILLLIYAVQFQCKTEDNGRLYVGGLGQAKLRSIRDVSKSLLFSILVRDTEVSGVVLTIAHPSTASTRRCE